MFKRLKDSLVRSFVGAITLGWIFSQAILHFAYIFSTPIASWLSRRLYADVLTEHGRAVRGFSPQEAIPELVKSIALLLLGYGLLRWLYFEPTPKPAENIESQ
jgi:hypothetical protein